MRSHPSVCLSFTLACLLVAAATDAPAQGRRSGAAGQADAPPAPGRRGGGAAAAAAQPAPMPSDPLTGPVVTKAPYSGDAVTTVTQILFDGTRIEEKTEARFYRDSAGRIRREQTILGLPGINPSTQAQTVVTIDPTPDDAFAYTLDPVARTARQVRRATGGAFTLELAGANLTYASVLGGLGNGQGLTIVAPGQGSGPGLEARRVRQQAGAPLLLNGVPIPGSGGKQTEESLGTRQIEGVRATGRKTTNIIPTGQIGNDRPIEITDERWESPDLKLLLYSRYSDPRTGVVEFKLTNISRVEQPADLFTVPSDYTVVEPGVGGLRTGGGGARGGRGAPQ